MSFRKSRLKVEESHDDLFAEEDCYKILDISNDASLEEIEKAYRRKAKEYHPDRVHNLGEKLRIVAQREFERIQHAYKSLSRQLSRSTNRGSNILTSEAWTSFRSICRTSIFTLSAPRMRIF